MGNNDIKSMIMALDTLHFAERVQALNRLREQYGEVVETLLEAHVAQQTHEEWDILRSIHPRCDIQELVNIQWEHISRSGGFEFTLEDSDEGILVHCTHCPLADMALHLDATRWGYLYYCSRSAIAAKSFNPNIGFERSKTLMEGFSYCDHHYRYRGQE